MKTRTRELARPGIYGTEDNPVIVSAEDLKQIAETFPDIRKAPIQLGHWGDPGRPRLGNVISVTWNEKTKTLVGTIEEQDALAQAVDDGFFPDVSIGSKRRASDGKMYLHHLAYLGEEPPAIKDLVSQVSQSLDPADPEAIAASDSDGVMLLPPLGTRLLHLADSAKRPQRSPKEGEPMTLEEIKADPEKAAKLLLTLSDQATSQKKTLDALASKYPEETLLLSDARDPQVGILTAQLRKGKKDGLLAAAAGKVPKAKLPLVGALADNLALNATIELSDGEAKEQVSGFDLMGRILEAIPTPVEPGRLDLSDPDHKTVVDVSNLMKKI